jgi:hypothetical protein
MRSKRMMWCGKCLQQCGVGIFFAMVVLVVIASAADIAAAASISTVVGDDSTIDVAAAVPIPSPDFVRHVRKLDDSIPQLPPSVLVRPTTAPTPATASPPPREEICPLNRQSTDKYVVEEYEDTYPSDWIDDDLSEISSLVFTSKGSKSGDYYYGYAVSDREQYSLKVLQFDRTTRQAKTVATYVLNVPSYSNDDWEDMSLGPCTSVSRTSTSPQDGTIDTCIYIGNFGNNPRNGYTVRTELQIFKFREPDFVNGTIPIDRTLDVSTIQYSYEDQLDYDGKKNTDTHILVFGLYNMQRPSSVCCKKVMVGSQYVHLSCFV